LRILVFNWRDVKHPEAGGAEIHLQEQARRWVDWGHQVTLFTSRPQGSSPVDQIDGVRVVRAGGFYTVYPRAALEYLRSLRKETDVILDLVNGIPFFSPAYARKPRVGLMHHVHSRQFLVEMGPVLGRVGRAVEYVFPALLRYDRIICISRSTAEDMKRYLLGARKLSLEVVYPGLNPVFYREPDREERERALRAYCLQPPYIAYIGNLHPRKNLATLVEAFAILRGRGLEHRLAVIGGGGLGRLNNLEYRKLMRRVRDLGLEDEVVFTGYVPDERLKSLLAQADMLVFPSIYEGFGLPPLEAMACGVPVITSRRASLPEVVGDAALLLEDPLDAEEIATGVETLLRDASLRARLVEKGRERARMFTWEEAARKVLEVYGRVVGS